MASVHLNVAPSSGHLCHVTAWIHSLNFSIKCEMCVSTGEWQPYEWARVTSVTELTRQQCHTISTGWPKLVTLWFLKLSLQSCKQKKWCHEMCTLTAAFCCDQSEYYPTISFKYPVFMPQCGQLLQNKTWHSVLTLLTPVMSLMSVVIQLQMCHVSYCQKSHYFILCWAYVI